MKRIWKFELQWTDEQRIEMPSGAEIVSVAFQDDTLCIWAIIDPAMWTEYRTFVIVGTGREIPRGMILSHLATVQQPPMVWHIFEKV